MINIRFLGGACVEIIGEEDHIIIDPNYKIAPQKGINTILITHEHEDHVDVDKIKKIQDTYIRENKELKLYGPKSVDEKLSLEMNLIEDEELVQLHNGRFKVFKIDCWKAESCVAYLIWVEGRTILHTADSAKYSDTLHKLKQHIDCCFVACFEDYYEDYFEFVKRLSPKLVIPYHFQKGEEEMAKNLVEFMKENDRVNAKFLEIGGKVDIE
mgnify:CR=1 FL=1